MNKISIIVPIYNVADYLEDCLDSLACQTYRNIEVIGVDDGSKDNSSNIFASYMDDKRFKLIINYENQGLPSARNLGLLNASGDYLYFVDSDDWISIDALEHLIEVALRDEVDIVIGGVAKYYDGNGQLETPANHGKVMAVERLGTNIIQAPELFFSVTSWNKLIRTDFLKHQGLMFKPTPRRYEDMLTYKWYLSGAKVSSISHITYFYRQRVSDNGNGSIMQDESLDAYSDKMLAYADILTFVKSRGYFMTKVDPLHSAYSMMNLPRALSWVLPKVFSLSATSDNERTNFIISLKKLVSLFDQDYIAELPEKIKSTVDYLAIASPCEASSRLFKN
jgi:glycosyltransferase involved in cell wall biosynthesis